MGCCCCCFQTDIPETSRSIDEHFPLSRQPSSSFASTSTSPLSPPIPLVLSTRNLHITPPKSPRNQCNCSEKARGIKQIVPLKETWPVSDLTELDLKKRDRETIDECPICLEEYETENPKLLTKCGHNFHLACILEWMERSEACPVCDKELVLTQS